MRGDTVEGRNSAPADIWGKQPIIYTCQVVQDFFHQQYQDEVMRLNLVEAGWSWLKFFVENLTHTVDGSDIRRDNQLVDSLSETQYLLLVWETYQVVAWDFWTMNSSFFLSVWGGGEMEF